MANYRIPGPLDASRGNHNVRDGTGQRMAGVTPGFINGPTPGNASAWDLSKNLERLEAVYDAVRIGQQRAGAAILRETGHALEELVKGLIPGLLMMMVVLVATTVIGGVIGAVIGFFAGGAGAAPGAVIGADLGISAGVTILTWLGLGFLIVGIAEGFGELIGALSHATTRAWNAPDSPRTRAEVEAAGDEYAHAVALLFKLILMAIVARLTLRQTRASTEETLALLRKSKLGEGFAAWVAKNQESLLSNPRLRPKPKATQSEAPVQGAKSPSQVKKQAQSEKPPEAEKPPAEKSKPKSKKKLKCGETGKYGDLKKATGGGAFDRDHIPSKAALKARAQSLLEDGEELSKKQAKAIEDWGNAIAIPRQAHIDVSPTYGTKNVTLAPKDAADLAGAARRDVDTMLGKIDQYDADGGCKDAYRKASEGILKMSNKDFDKALLDIVNKVK